MTTAETNEYTRHVEPFGDGFKITLTSPNLRVALLTKGATVASIQYKAPHLIGSKIADKEGWVELTLNYDNPEEFEHDNNYMGRTCGRYAGRIENGEITLEEHIFKLMQNDGANTLHGGPEGFSHRPWKYIFVEGADEIGISFHLISPHLDQGFPGEVFVTATYSILKGTEAKFKWSLQAVLSDNSPVNLTSVNLCSHIYWNLNGVAFPRQLPLQITNHELQIHASYFAESNGGIPTGGMKAIANTPHDYRNKRNIKTGIEITAQEGREPAGYDDAIALDTWDGTLREAAILTSPETNISMRVETTSPAIVVYTGNYLPVNANGNAGQRFQQHSGICLETQFFPNSPNIDSFPSTILKKGERYDETTVCHFRVLPRG